MNSKHIATISELILERVNLLKMVCRKKWGDDVIIMTLLYLQHITSKITYGCKVWGRAAMTLHEAGNFIWK